MVRKPGPRRLPLFHDTGMVRMGISRKMLSVAKRLQNSFKEPAISSHHLLKSIDKGNLYFDPLHKID